MAYENKKYKVMIPRFSEHMYEHQKGEFLKLDITETRAKQLIAAGIITEVAPEQEKKDLKAPVDKMIREPEEKKDIPEGESTESTGKGASLLKKKVKK